MATTKQAPRARLPRTARTGLRIMLALAVRRLDTARIAAAITPPPYRPRPAHAKVASPFHQRCGQRAHAAAGRTTLSRDRDGPALSLVGHPAPPVAVPADGGLGGGRPCLHRPLPRPFGAVLAAHHRRLRP